MLKLLFFALSLFNLFSKTGHFLVANIAETIMEKENPLLLKVIKKDLREFSKYMKADDHIFIESSSWPDDIKFKNFNIFNNWHYNNRPYFNDDFKNKNYFLNQTKFSNINIIKVLNSALFTISNKKQEQHQVIYEKSFMIKYWIHLVGDIHQPLHNIRLINKKFPKSDLGGNKFKINLPNNKKISLHKLWDSIFSKYKRIKSPMSNNDYLYLQNATKELMKKYPKNSFGKNFLNKNFKDWSNENYKIAVDYCYGNLKPNQKVNQNYLDNGIKILEKNIVKAGYRLSYLLLNNYKYKNTNRRIYN